MPFSPITGTWTNLVSFASNLCIFVLAAAVTNITAAPAASPALSLSASKWIWTPTFTPSAEVAFRKDFTPPLGKSLIAAEVIITAVTSMNLYVNGDYIGSGSAPGRWGYAQRFCIDLLPSFNVFAVNASTPSATIGGLIGTILVTYSDGTTDTLLTDSSWRVTTGSPAGFEQLSFDDTAWGVATAKGAFGAEPWGTVLIPSDPPVPSLFAAQWVWTNVVPESGSLPAGSRAFRRIFTPAPGQTPLSANIIVSTDNEYTLYVNGVTVGTGTDFKIAQQYVVEFGTAVSEIVVAVLATNAAVGAAGVLLMMEVNMQPSGRASCTAGSIISSDNAWKSTLDAIPTGFE